MFRQECVNGILIAAVNSGDEQGVALTIRESGLRVPILIVACREQSPLTPTVERRDSFCGLPGIGQALRQMGLPYSVPERPVCFPEDESLRGTLERLLGVCRVVGGVRTARYGQVGARPDAFGTSAWRDSLHDVMKTLLDIRAQTRRQGGGTGVPPVARRRIRAHADGGLGAHHNRSTDAHSRADGNPRVPLRTLRGSAFPCPGR